jgi:signal peptidase II
MNRIYAILLSVAALVLAADQGTKALALSDLVNEGNSRNLFSWFSWTLVHNHGVAFGMFRNLPDGGRVWMLNLLTLTIVFLLWRNIVRTFQESDRLGPLWTGMVLGGAMGNFIDRTRLGYVIDFIDWAYPSASGKCIPLFDAMGDNKCHWPVFNVADSAIVCAMVIAFIHSYRIEKQRAKSQ